MSHPFSSSCCEAPSASSASGRPAPASSLGTRWATSWACTTTRRPSGRRRQTLAGSGTSSRTRTRGQSWREGKMCHAKEIGAGFPHKILVHGIAGFGGGVCVSQYIRVSNVCTLLNKKWVLEGGGGCQSPSWATMPHILLLLSPKQIGAGFPPKLYHNL